MEVYYYFCCNAKLATPKSNIGEWSQKDIIVKEKKKQNSMLSNSASRTQSTGRYRWVSHFFTTFFQLTTSSPPGKLSSLLVVYLARQVLLSSRFACFSLFFSATRSTYQSFTAFSPTHFLPTSVSNFRYLLILLPRRPFSSSSSLSRWFHLRS